MVVNASTASPWLRELSGMLLLIWAAGAVISIAGWPVDCGNWPAERRERSRLKEPAGAGAARKFAAR